jgi:hypothetical protein
MPPAARQVASEFVSMAFRSPKPPNLECEGWLSGNCKALTEPFHMSAHLIAGACVEGMAREAWWRAGPHSSSVPWPIAGRG